MLEQQINDVFAYTEERCLWQFFSRTWDREENIQGVLDQVAAILCGQEPKRDTPMDRLFYADGKIMAEDLRTRYAWVKDASAELIRQVMDGLKARLVDVAITRSTNRELNHHLY